MAPTIWIDVEDFLHYFAHNPRPSGIQRFAFELMRALIAVAGPERVRFLRRAPGAEPPVREVTWAELDAIFHHPAEPPQGAAGPALRPGDVYLVPGSPWAVPGFVETLAALKRRYRLVTGLLVHDIIPIRRPEWTGRHGSSVFAAFIEDCLPLFDRLLANSRHTASDLEAYARQRGLRLASPIRPIPVGNGFGQAAPEAAPEGLPRPGSYVLVVATIEPRKNHELAVRVWRRLVDEVQAGTRSARSVPALVFAGRVGWMVGDLLQQLEYSYWLDGRVRLIRNPSDQELRQLYRGCLFTFVPSWFEGYGLPVTESLSLGKPCLASSATALPEAGGDLCRYIDPGDLPAAYRAVAALIDDPAALAAWQEQVVREFRPVPWAESAEATLQHLAA